MYDTSKIALWAVTKATNNGVDVDVDLIDYEIERAIAFGCTHRNCTPAELLAETKDYTTVLTEMVVSALTLTDKLGRVGNMENGIQNQFEDGNIYQKEHTKVFVPLMRGVSK